LAKNDGIGIFTIQSPKISSTLNSAGGTAIAHLNGDGFNEVVTTSYNDNALVGLPMMVMVYSLLILILFL
jgi:hypothetical protein